MRFGTLNFQNPLTFSLLKILLLSLCCTVGHDTVMLSAPDKRPRTEKALAAPGSRQGTLSQTGRVQPGCHTGLPPFIQTG